jgi:glycerophosphoryl diester phosphodiesterase
MAGRTIVSCFDLGSVDRVRSLDDGVPTAYLVHLTDPALVAAAVRTCVEHGHAAVHPWDPSVDEALVALAHDAGIAVNTWTVDDPSRIRALAAMGVDGIVTNVPDVALRALGR